MKIALIGASGNIGSEIAREALRRGHIVTAVVRQAKPGTGDLPGLQTRHADLFDAAALRDAVRGHDVIASAYGPGAGNPGAVVEATAALIAAARSAGIARLVVVGGAGSLEIGPGAQLVDSPNFPAAYKAVALAHRDAFTHLRQASDLKWTFFAPAAMIGPGEKTGRYRVGRKTLIADATGASKISYADYADAFVTELERGEYPQEIVTAAY
ncbi:MAG TPA: NAD(P)H-binding protein [Rhodocyclaceae bacterium]|nr:NAD(P)H-binding protein [Rhodocyclaceae bacterium]